MARLRRFPDNRVIGRRDQMVAFDCDDPDQFAELEQADTALDLTLRNLMSTFAPDTLAEARNRGFQPARANRHFPTAKRGPERAQVSLSPDRLG